MPMPHESSRIEVSLCLFISTLYKLLADTALSALHSHCSQSQNVVKAIIKCFVITTFRGWTASSGPRQRQMSCLRRQRRPRLRHAVDATTCK